MAATDATAVAFAPTLLSPSRTPLFGHADNVRPASFRDHSAQVVNEADPSVAPRSRDRALSYL